MDKYKRYRYPIAIISHVVWCYFRFCLSLRDIEELMFVRGFLLSHETIRTWSKKYGSLYAAGIKKRKAIKGDKWHVDEMCVKISGQRYWLFRAVDQNGYELDVLLQPRRNKKAVIRFFKQVLKDCQYVPRVMVTDKLKSYKLPCKLLLPNTQHRTHKRLTNRVENAHQPTRRRERQIIRFKSAASANQFVATHGQVRNLFNINRYKYSSDDRRSCLSKALDVWHNLAHSCEQYAE